jgi:hypothetical protein
MNTARAAIRSSRILQVAVAFAIGALGAAALSVVTSQGFLHAATETGAGYTGSTTPTGPEGQLLMVALWVAIGGLAGYLGRTALAFAGLWLGALVGSLVGFAGDPQDNILWFDLVVTIFGITMFLAPGFLLGAGLAGSRSRFEPDGSGRRPPPPPLWSRGRRWTSAGRTAQPTSRATVVPPSGSAPTSYARPTPPASESAPSEPAGS